MSPTTPVHRWQAKLVRDATYDEGKSGAWEVYLLRDAAQEASWIHACTREEAIDWAREMRERLAKTDRRREELIDLDKLAPGELDPRD